MRHITSFIFQPHLPLTTVKTIYCLSNSIILAGILVANFDFVELFVFEMMRLSFPDFIICANSAV